MHDLAVTCFGVGDGSPCADRGHSSFLYELPGATLLIDCGEPVSGRFKASGKAYDAIDRILVSHMHFDHIGGFFMLMQGFWLEGRTRDLPVHMAAHGIDPVKKLLQSACLFDELLPFKLRFDPLQDGISINQGSVRITPYLTSHLDGFRKRFEEQYPDHYDAFSFLIETPRQRNGHSADIGSIQDLEPLLTGPLDLLVVELAHFEPEDLFTRLQDAAVGFILFTHVGRPHWEALDTVTRLATAMLPDKKFAFARDQQTIKL
jgi:ribonuclease Z